MENAIAIDNWVEQINERHETIKELAVLSDVKKDRPKVILSHRLVYIDADQPLADIFGDGGKIVIVIADKSLGFSRCFRKNEPDLLRLFNTVNSRIDQVKDQIDDINFTSGFELAQIKYGDCTVAKQIIIDDIFKFNFFTVDYNGGALNPQILSANQFISNSANQLEAFVILTEPELSVIEREALIQTSGLEGSKLYFRPTFDIAGGAKKHFEHARKKAEGDFKKVVTKGGDPAKKAEEAAKKVAQQVADEFKQALAKHEQNCAIKMAIQKAKGKISTEYLDYRLIKKLKNHDVLSSKNEFSIDELLTIRSIVLMNSE